MTRPAGIIPSPRPLPPREEAITAGLSDEDALPLNRGGMGGGESAPQGPKARPFNRKESRPKRMVRAALALLALALAFSFAPDARAGEAAKLFTAHCAQCHGADRLGGTGPALLPETLGRLGRARARKVIAEGRAATQMPAFGETLSEAEIAALADYVFTAPASPPRWGAREIESSRKTLVPPERWPAKPVFDADPLNLFVVVEAGDHHITILDGDRFTPLARLPTHFAVHGGPKFSPDGRFVYLVSRDGWVSKVDLWGLKTVAEVRVSINARNLAISGDGRVLAVANTLPKTLVLLDARTLSLLRVIPATDRAGKRASRVSAVYQAAPRNSFVVALKDLPEMWEIYYGDDPPAGFASFAHSYEEGMVEAAAAKRFAIRRIDLDRPLEDFFFSPDYRLVFGSSRAEGGAVVVNLNVGREIAQVPIPGLPHLGAGITWMRDGRRVLATPNLREGAISVIDMTDWRVIKTIPTLGPGFFLRSHENSRYAWADVFFGPNRDAMQVIDKESLEVVKTLRPAPGKTSAHVEFTRDGRYALVSIWDMDGAIVVYDAKTLEEVKRIPMRKPSGKYNVYNKITRSAGTSH